MTEIETRFGKRYRFFFIICILVATFSPAALSVINFDITEQKIRVLGSLFVLLLLLNGAHVWMTIAYFFDKNWIDFFKKRKLIFFGGPIMILLISLLVLTQSSKTWALAFFYSAAFINLWHHAKQNWGILTIFSKIFNSNISVFKPLIVNSWIFFLIPLSYYIVSAFNLLELRPNIMLISYGIVVLYLSWCFKELYSHFGSVKHPLVKVQLLGSLVYFLPLIFLKDKYYVLVIWAGAHALQYYFLVFSSLTLKNWKSISTFNVFIRAAIVIGCLICLTLISTLFTKPLASPDYWDNINIRYIAAILIAVNLSHFWIDAFIWKFSSSTVREAHGDAFTF